MGLTYEDEHVYDNTNFNDFAFSMINRYPNPQALHIKSVDILSTSLVAISGSNNTQHKLKFTRLIRKLGSLPRWTPSILRISDSFILETITVNPVDKVIDSRQQNIDHLNFLKVIEINNYKYNADKNEVKQRTKVEFISNIEHGVMAKSVWERLSSRVHLGSKIERFCVNSYHKRIMKSREGIKWKVEYFKLKNGLASL